jgi:hypothetical protein
MNTMISEILVAGPFQTRWSKDAPRFGFVALKSGTTYAWAAADSILPACCGHDSDHDETKVAFADSAADTRLLLSKSLPSKAVSSSTCWTRLEAFSIVSITYGPVGANAIRTAFAT